MNCAKHPELPAAAYCRTCGRALCETCKRDIHGVIYCEDCLAGRVQTAPPVMVASVPSGGPNPAVAGVLSGFFPFGVGQVYNGQYARGLVYLVVFVFLIWAANDISEYFALAMAAFWFWQLMDAIRSANQIRLGLPPADPFGIDRLFSGTGVQVAPASVSTGAASAAIMPGVVPQSADYGVPVAGHLPVSTADAQFAGDCCRRTRVPVGAVVLIALGALFLLGNLGILHWYWAGDFWPLILIAIGAWQLAKHWGAITSGTIRGRRCLMGPAVLLTLGSMFLVHQVGHTPFHRTWPLLLIVIGAVMIWQRAGTAYIPQPPAMPTPRQTGSEEPAEAQTHEDFERQER